MKILFSVFVSVIICASLLRAQEFTTSPYITIPGNNSQIDVVTNSFFSYSGASYICWLNQDGNVYTVYLKQTSPDTSKTIAVYSDTNQIENPKIDFVNLYYPTRVRIVWQNYINNHWQILSREFVNDTLSNIVSMTDSLNDNITPALNYQILAWIQNGKLLIRYLDSTKTGIITLDSIGCSNPDLSKDWGTTITYEKGVTGSKEIYTAYYSNYPTPEWSFEKISGGGNNINPRYGPLSGYGSPAYQSYSNGVWKIISPLLPHDTSANINYNCENAVSFSYPVLTKRTGYYTPFFVVYDSDSLSQTNREIIFKTANWGGQYYDSTINLSNSAGDDYKPFISFYRTDTLYLAIFWTHNENGKQDIWMAKTIYNPDFGAVTDPSGSVNGFSLGQNYPNPFNPSTTISYSIPQRSYVTLKVYDMLGKEVSVLVNEEKNAGSYRIKFNGSTLSSGIYFYKLQAGNFTQTKKLILLK